MLNVTLQLLNECGYFEVLNVVLQLLNECRYFELSAECGSSAS